LTTSQTVDLESALTLTEGVRAYLHNIMLQFGGQMTANQIVVLLRISLDHVRNKKCTVQSIAESEGISQQTVSGCVVRLEAHGYIEPLKCREDGRVRYLRLSEKGIELSEAALSETLSNSLLSLRAEGEVAEHRSDA
jgi:DNA-binding MarR family transcriptional regulator